MSLFNFSQDQKYLLEFYTNIYNENNRQIDLLYANNDIIRQHINEIAGLNSFGNYHHRRQRWLYNQRERIRQQQQRDQQQQQQQSNLFIPRQNATNLLQIPLPIQNTTQNTTQNTNFQNVSSVFTASSNPFSLGSSTNTNTNQTQSRRNRRPTIVSHSTNSSSSIRPVMTTDTQTMVPTITTFEFATIDRPLFPAYNSRTSNNDDDNDNEQTQDVITGFLQQFYDSIPVIPSQRQIERATKLIRFGEIEEPKNSTCPISLERFDSETNVTQIIDCGHLFKSASIQQWFRSNTRCPMCRFDIRNTISNPNSASASASVSASASASASGVV